MIITVTLNPAIDKTSQIASITLNGLNRLENTVIDLGGKGINVSKVIKEIGDQSIATGFVAGSNGKYILEQLDMLDIKNDFIEISGNTRINLKVLDKDMNLTEFSETTSNVTKQDLDSFKNKLKALINKNDIVVLSGSVPQNTPRNYYQELINLSKEQGASTILDADGDLFDYGVQAIPSVIKPNKYELCKYFKLDEDIDNLDLIDYCLEFINLGIELVVVSLGKDGALFINKEHHILVPGLKIKAHSSVGAGDSMVGAIAYALNNQLSLEELIKLAIASSAGAVTTIGTKAPSLDLIKELKDLVEIEYLK